MSLYAVNGKSAGIWIPTVFATMLSCLRLRSVAALTYLVISVISGATHAGASHWQTILKSVDLFSLPFSLRHFFQCFLVNLPIERGGGGNRTRE